MLFEGGFTFRNFVTDVFAVFMFVLWFWLLISVSSDLFRRRDVSGFGKVLWVILLIVLPYIGIFAYIFAQGRGMAERNEARTKHAEDNLRQIVGFSAADEIEKLDRLKSTKSISEQEYTRLEPELFSSQRVLARPRYQFAFRLKRWRSAASTENAPPLALFPAEDVHAIAVSEG